jgi:cell division transport system permease protein
VTNVQTVGREELQDILQPWLGDISSFPDLPLPTLLEISLQPEHDMNMDALAKKLSDAVPGVQLIAHYAWAGEVQRLANTISIVAFGVMLFIGFVLLLIMFFAARARLAMFAPEVEVLHTLGATDGFVAGEFQAQALRLSFWGAIFGLLALLAVLGETLSFAFPEIFAALRNMNGDISMLEEWRYEIMGLFILPVAIVILNTLAARVAVLSALRRLT